MGVTLEGRRHGKESVWVLKTRQGARRALVKKIMIRHRKKTLEGSRRRPCGRAVHRRLKTLKELVPNTKASQLGLDGLFIQTADYILALEMKVTLMRTMLQVLTHTDCI